MRLFYTLCVAAVCLFVVACSREAKTKGYGPEYSNDPPNEETVLLFGVLPYYNPQHLYEDYGPLIAYLNRNLHRVKVELIASRSFEEFEKRLYSGALHLALPNPNEAVDSLTHGYRIFGKMGNDVEYRGLLVVRKDGGINTIADLKGKTISLPSPLALATAKMPIYFLRTHGLEVDRDFHRLYSGSQESAIMNVYLGKSAAGAIRPPHWKTFTEEHPEIASKLVVKWETPPLINEALVARDDVPKQIVDAVAALLFDLQTHTEGRAILNGMDVTEFQKATNETYQPVSDFLQKYQGAAR